MTPLSEIVTWGVVAAVFFALVAWLLVRQLRTIPPELEGILYSVGYLKTLPPGRHFVNPLEHLVLAPAGSTARFRIGQTARVVKTIESPTAPGRVRSADMEFIAFPLRFSARRPQPIPQGEEVVIQGFRPPEGVYVSVLPTRSRLRAGGSSGRRPST